ncbi:MAG: AraC family transcriptional regulator [Dorea sp.]
MRKEMIQPKLIQTYYIDMHYSQNHAHMLHKHKNTLEILYIAGGEGRYIVGKREYAVVPGDIVICNAGIIHGEAPFLQHTIQTYCCAYRDVHIEGLPDNYLLDPNYKPVINMEDFTEHMKGLMQMTHELFTEDTCNQEICQHLAQAIFMTVQKKLEQYQESGKETVDRKKEYLVRGITEYIDQNYMEKLTLQEISEKFYISASSLSHIFKRETGLSPMQYMMHRRIGEAQSLLMETNIPIHEIEEQLGFGSSCHFSVTFKKYVGISPKEYRDHFK